MIEFIESKVIELKEIKRMIKFLDKLNDRLKVRVGHAENAEEGKLIKETVHFQKYFNRIIG